MEDGGERWSKPYVATLSLHSLFALRSCILNGTVMLDMRASSMEEVAGGALALHLAPVTRIITSLPPYGHVHPYID